MNLVLDKNVPYNTSVSGRPKGSKNPIYELGSDVFNLLQEIGDSTLIGNVNPKALHMRLNRICEEKKSTNKYSIRKEDSKFRIYRIQ
jgi:hypothetical protein